MGWAYTKRPARSAREALCLRIGEANASDPLHSDEEADYYMGLQPENMVLAAVEEVVTMGAEKGGRRCNLLMGL